MKGKSGPDEPSASTAGSEPDLRQRLRAMAEIGSYLLVLVLGALTFWRLLALAGLLPSTSPMSASGSQARVDVGRGLLLFGGFTAWTWLANANSRRTWRRTRHNALIPLRVLGAPRSSAFAGLLGVVTVVVGVWLGGARVVASTVNFDAPLWWLMTLFLLLAAALEELAFRGVLLSLCASAFGRRPALALTAGLFAWMHQSNPGANTIGLVNTVLAGWVLGELVLRTGSLCPAVALHWTWNWTQGLLLGLPVSGQLASTSLLRLAPGNGPLAGGLYGFEGGLAATVVLAPAMLWALRTRASARGLEESASPGHE